MRKAAFIFVLAIVAPAAALGWLAIRSISNQKVVFERQQTFLFQSACQSVVDKVHAFVAERQREFGGSVEDLLAEKDARQVAEEFDELIVSRWQSAEVGFAVSLDGHVLSPSLLSRAEARRFRIENDLFLSSQESVEVYWNTPKGAISLTKLDAKENSASKESDGKGDKLRKVTPQAEPGSEPKPVSSVTSAEGDFRRLIGDGTDGVLGRFLQNRLKLLIWHRPARNRDLVFGAQLRFPQLVEDLSELIRTDAALAHDVCIALLDDSGRPVAQSKPAFAADWKRPFVSAEIGEVLPHWEVAAYLVNPNRVADSVRALSFTLGLVILLLLLAIGVGGWLVFADLRRQITLARQKTDFVSNVSHELKTPLTSIRMFAELLAEGRVTDDEKRRSYLNIIAAETARLTRLINNVLDFARLDRGEKKYCFQPIDIAKIVRETVQSYRPHLEQAGFSFSAEIPAQAMMVNADADAIAQVFVNLISNAEKYSADRKEIAIELRSDHDSKREMVELRVLDRGAGVPQDCEEKIFEQFFRAHDALNSGTQGSGLGLTLARQIARAHGGDVFYERRDGGGSCFVLKLPVATREATGQSLASPAEN